MTRGVGELELFAAAPESLFAAFAVLTLLGDTIVVFALLSVLYWLAPGDRERTRSAALAVIALAAAALGLTLAIKVLVGAPRPPEIPTIPGWLPGAIEGFVRGELDASGYGFPSGHAIAATVLYGGLATFLSAGGTRARRRRAWLVAGGLIAIVALSRVVLQVHYLVDVVAGVLVGLGLLWGVRAIADPKFELPFFAGPTDRRSSRPGAREIPQIGRLFAIAALLAGTGVVAGLWTGAAREIGIAALALGTAIGGGLVWRRFGDRMLSAPPLGPIAAIVTFALAAAVWIGGYGVAESPIVTALSGAIGVIVVIVAPLVVDRHPAETIERGLENRR